LERGKANSLEEKSLKDKLLTHDLEIRNYHAKQVMEFLSII
jgi:hypothetical protein